MQFMNMNINKYISQNNMYLLAIVVVSIVIFASLSGPREGFNNYISTGNTDDKSDDSSDNELDIEMYIKKNNNNNNNNNNKQKNKQKNNNNYNNNNNNDNNQKPQHDNRLRGGVRGSAGQEGLLSKTNIPEGDEDLYILKSEVIPPVCPACPNVTACPTNKAPPPCPPCARCPEPSFDCKKVPNYSSNNSEYLPRPVLADFSQFGM